MPLPNPITFIKCDSRYELLMRRGAYILLDRLANGRQYVVGEEQSYYVGAGLWGKSTKNVIVATFTGATPDLCHYLYLPNITPAEFETVKNDFLSAHNLDEQTISTATVKLPTGWIIEA